MERRAGELFRGLRIFDTFAGLHFVILGEALRGVRVEEIGDEFDIDGVIEGHGEFFEGFKIEGEEKRPRGEGIDIFPAADAEDFGNFEQTHSGGHHELLEFLWGDLVMELAESEMMDHGVRSGFPVEGALHDGIDVANGEDADKAEHTKEDGGGVALGDEVAIDDRPGIHENDLDIEEDEEHRDEVKLDTEAGLGVAGGGDSAFVSGVFGGVCFGGFAEENAGDESGGGEADGDDDLEKDGKVFAHREAEELGGGWSGGGAFWGKGFEGGENFGDALIFFFDFFDHAAADEILQFFVGAEAEHFFATAGGVAGFEFSVNQFKEILEFEVGSGH